MTQPNDARGSAVGPFDLDRIVAETFVRRVVYYDRLESTNDWALEHVSQQLPETPLLVLADQQTAGRGRGASRWWSGPGALTFSLVLNSARDNLPAGHWPQASLVTGLSVCEALLKRVPAHDVRLKWPNDVYFQGRKICGILVETSAARSGMLVVGIGVNVNNSFADAPLPLSDTATSLLDITGRQWDRTEALVQLLEQIAQNLRLLADEPAALSERWRSFCMLEGRTICLETGRRQAVGVCQGIADDGALLLQSESGIERFYAGVVRRIL